MPKRKELETRVPGDQRFPLSDWSLTVTVRGDDVSKTAIDHAYDFLERYCLKGLVSTEVGSRAFRYHLQGVFRTRYPDGPRDQKLLATFIKDLMPEGGFCYSVMCKPLAGRHCFTTMLGYCLKDDGMDWFRCRMFNVTRSSQYTLSYLLIAIREELEQGRSAHIANRTSYDQNKVLLTQRNIIAEMFKYANRALYPCHVPLRYALLYAIQSVLYIPSPEWLKKIGKLEHSDAESMWKLIYTPSNVTLREIDSIFFDPQSMPQTGSRRYFVSARPGNITGTAKRASSPSLLSPYARIMILLRNHSCAKRSLRKVGELELIDDFVKLPSDAGILPVGYSVTTETDATDAMGEHEQAACPDNLEEMMFIVRSLRGDPHDVYDPDLDSQGVDAEMLAEPVAIDLNFPDELGLIEAKSDD